MASRVSSAIQARMAAYSKVASPGGDRRGERDFVSPPPRAGPSGAEATAEGADDRHDADEERRAGDGTDDDAGGPGSERPTGPRGRPKDMPEVASSPLWDRMAAFGGGVRTPRRSAAGSARQSPAGHPSDAAILATDGGGAAAAEPETTNPGSPPAARASALDFPFGRFGPRAPAGRAGGQPAGCPGKLDADSAADVASPRPPKSEAGAPRDGGHGAVSPRTPRTRARSGVLRERMAAYQQRAENVEYRHDTKPTDVPALPGDTLRSRMAAFGDASPEESTATGDGIEKGGEAVKSAEIAERAAVTGRLDDASPDKENEAEARRDVGPGAVAPRTPRAGARSGVLRERMAAYQKEAESAEFRHDTKPTDVPALPRDTLRSRMATFGDTSPEILNVTGDGIEKSGEAVKSAEIAERAAETGRPDDASPGNELKVICGAGEDSSAEDTCTPKAKEASSALMGRMAAYQREAENKNRMQNAESNSNTKPTDVPALPRDTLRSRMATFGDASADESNVTGDGIEKSGDAVKSTGTGERDERAAEASRPPRPAVEAMAPRDGEPEAVAPHTPRTRARSDALRGRMAAYQKKAENVEYRRDTQPTDVPALPRDTLRSRMAAFSGRYHEPAAAGSTAVAATAGSEEDAATADAAGETSPGKECAGPVASRPASLKNKIDAYLSSPKAEKPPVPSKPADMPDPLSNLLESRMNAVGDAGEGSSDRAADTGTGTADGAGSAAESRLAEPVVHEAVPAQTDARHETDALRVVESVREDDEGHQPHAPRISSDALRERMAAYQHKAENIEFRRDTRPTDVPVLPKDMLRRRMAAFSGQRSDDDDGATAEEGIGLSPTGRTTISGEIPKDNTAKKDLVVDVAPAPDEQGTGGESSPMSSKDFSRPVDVPRSFLKDKMNAYLSSPNTEKAPVKPDDMPDLPSNLLKSRMNAFGGGHEADSADEKTETADEGGESPAVSEVTRDVPAGGPDEGTDGAAMGGFSSPPRAPVYPADMPRQQSLKDKMDAYLSSPRGKERASVGRPRDMPDLPSDMLKTSMLKFDQSTF